MSVMPKCDANVLFDKIFWREGDSSSVKKKFIRGKESLRENREAGGGYDK